MDVNGATRGLEHGNHRCIGLQSIQLAHSALDEREEGGRIRRGKGRREEGWIG